MRKYATHPDQIVGLLLAGGEGSRLGGIDKGMKAWNGRPMAEWVFRALSATVSIVLVSANRSLNDYEALAPGRVWQDIEAARSQGPLAGLLTGLRAAEALGVKAVVVCPCDTPDITPAVLQALVESWQEAPERPVVAECEDRIHPLHGVYPVALAGLIEHQLSEGNRRVMALVDSANTRFLKIDSPEAFINKNTHEDFI